jgi:16S rRNA (guanine527-N7)-methyltransferase
MPPSSFAALIQAQLDILITEQQAACFERYSHMLLEWNERINLTAITNPKAIQIRHYLDSLVIAKSVDLRDGMRVIDVGTGAGFPGVPLQILHPGLHMTLLEATGKKVAFLNHLIQTLPLPNTHSLKLRAEEAGQMPAHRQQYDLALARAVARLPVLLEYLLPLVRIGGLCVAMKGESAQTEVSDSTHALRVLGGRLVKIDSFDLPGVEERHFLVVIEKTTHTPAQYPRRPGLPTRSPL